MEQAYIKKQGKILVVFDAGSDWMEALPVNERTTVTVGKGLPAVFERQRIRICER